MTRLPSYEPEQYGTQMHWPTCIDGQCTGCLPPILEDLFANPAEPCCAEALGVHVIPHHDCSQERHG